MVTLGPKVLLVDDEQSILRSLSRMFRMNGIDVATADSGTMAMDIIRKEPIDLVISDHMMPEMSGLDLMVQIRDTYPEIIRIMLTASFERQVMQKAINQGEIYRFFVKPWNEDELLDAVRSGIKHKSDTVGEKNRIVDELTRSNIETVMALAEAIELKDTYTKGHCSRVRDYSVRMARAVGLPSGLLIHLVYGALLHDCGKIGVAESILLKSGKLDESERKAIEYHSILGFELTNSVSHLKTASLFIRQHHERWDGTGYPDGLCQDEAHICSRIISIADTFDAMTSDRPYRKGMAIDKARQILIENKGAQFDPELVDLFVSILDKKGVAGMLENSYADDAPTMPVILFVDDELPVLKSMYRIMTAENYTVKTASSADEALEILDRQNVDLVVSDQRMPGGTGVQLLRTVKLKYPGTVRIMRFGYADLNETMAAINEAGVYKVLMKPWNDGELKVTIKNALEWQHMSRTCISDISHV
ncbi:MAG: response regulator [Desulfobacteraceae bacterium]|nr:response regulator [Desulfobacteraceae bacterium]